VGRGVFEFSYKKLSVLPIFVVKNYLWPETGTGGGLIDPLGAEDVKVRRGRGENLAGGVQLPLSACTVEFGASFL